MKQELTLKEQAYLVDLLKERLGTQREQIYHTDTSSFKDQMKEEAAILRSLIAKFAEEPNVKTGTSY
jgi:hypothetical protein